MLRIAKGGWSHIAVGLTLLGAGLVVCLTGCCGLSWTLVVLGLVVTAFMIYFFRDPERTSAEDEATILAGADGWVRQVELIPENRFLKAQCVRVCTFLTPFDVHVNRAPMAGTVTKLDYTPGRHLLTIQQAASEHNEHSSILIEGARTRCLVKQIVGPIVRRVVYWLDEGQALSRGDRIGIMKFGSRLDVYLPADDVEVLVKRGDRVFAGITPVARIKKQRT